jgi:hypothetical protein
MNLNRVTPKRLPVSLSIAALGFLALAAGGGGGGGGNSQMGGPTTTGFADTALVATNVGVVATVTTIDASLSNPWGIAPAQELPLWIADSNSNLATLHSGKGNTETNKFTGSTDVRVALPASAAGVAAIATGQVYSADGACLIPTREGQETALFIFDGKGGTLAAWTKDSGSTAVTAYDDGVNHVVLIGNFGDGKINIIAPNGTSLATSMGPPTVTNGGTLSIPGLWSVTFGIGDADKPLTTLFYTAAFADQANRLFGSLSTTSVPTANPY